MVVAQKVKEAEITEQDSLLLTRNLLRIAIFNISYIRGLFPEKYFNDKSVPALEMKIKKLMPMDAESRRLIDWMEKGVYDALQKKYLKTLLFCVCERVDGPMIEEYAFSFSYASSDSDEVSMNISRKGSKKAGATFKDGFNDITPNQMRSSACKMVRTLIQLMRTLDRMPEERTILMKLMYNDDVTPVDYEPPFFRGCSEEEAAYNQWSKKPLKMEVGDVNSKHFVLALKVKSVLDPCEDDNDDLQEDEVSLGADSMQQNCDDSSSTDTEDNHQYVVAPAGQCTTEQPGSNENGMLDEDDTQDGDLEANKLTSVREWINSRHTETIELTDILANFPDISVALIEDIVSKLCSEGLLAIAGRDKYNINRGKEDKAKLNQVKEEAQSEESHDEGGSPVAVSEDYMYMKALYHALPMDYITVSKLQNKMKGEANQRTVRRLMDKMAQDGYIEDRRTGRLGKRIVHNDLADRKLLEIKKALDGRASEVETAGKFSKLEYLAKVATGQSNNMNGSTCGGLHSIGSDLTRTCMISTSHLNGSTRSGQTSCPKPLDAGSPTSFAKPMASLESMIPGAAAVGGPDNDPDVFQCSRSTQEKRSRKTSMVEEPILQYTKRQRSQAA